MQINWYFTAVVELVFFATGLHKERFSVYLSGRTIFTPQEEKCDFFQLEKTD